MDGWNLDDLISPSKDKKKYKRQEDLIKDSIDEMQYYLDRLSNVSKIGSIYSCSCCFHDEKTPSLRIFPPGYTNPDGTKQAHSSFYCFGCGKGGDIIKFEQLYEDLNTRGEAITSLMRKYDLELDDGDKISELKLSLKELEKSREDKSTLSLNDINLVCSILCRNYLKEIKNEYPTHFNEEFKFIQSIYRKLDNKLLEMNAIEAEQLIELTKNSINKRKKQIKNLTN